MIFLKTIGVDFLTFQPYHLLGCKWRDMDFQGPSLEGPKRPTETTNSEHRDVSTRFASPSCSHQHLVGFFVGGWKLTLQGNLTWVGTSYLHPRERCRCNKRSKKVDFRALGLLVIPIKNVQNGCMSLGHTSWEKHSFCCFETTLWENKKTKTLANCRVEVDVDIYIYICTPILVGRHFEPTSSKTDLI